MFTFIFQKPNEHLIFIRYFFLRKLKSEGLAYKNVSECLLNELNVADTA